MEFQLEPVWRSPAEVAQEMSRCNEISARYGLALSSVQMQMLAESRRCALRGAGRVEFGGGILEKLVRAFCNSPYLQQDAYADTLAELQETFYQLKTECADRLSDDELIARMRCAFDTAAGGSAADLASTGLWELCRALRNGQRPDAAEEEAARD